MITVSSTQIQQNFGQYLKKSRNEPIAISKTGDIEAVLLSFDEYKKLERLEDLYWLMLAKEAEKEGFLSPEESEHFLKSRLMEIDNET